jgi:hypothetical protein
MTTAAMEAHDVFDGNANQLLRHGGIRLEEGDKLVVGGGSVPESGKVGYHLDEVFGIEVWLRFQIDVGKRPNMLE